MKIKVIFAWYDFWIGFFWDTKKKWLYIFLIPTLGIVLKFKKPENTNEVQAFMDDVHQWADVTFGKDRTAIAPLHHLKKEVDEAIEAMNSQVLFDIREELADCFILILNATSKYGLEFNTLFSDAKEKMVKNKTRKWGKPDENGVCLHIKENTESTYVPDTGNMVQGVKYAVFHSSSEDQYEQLSNPFDKYEDAVAFAERQNKERFPYPKIFAWMPLSKSSADK